MSNVAVNLRHYRVKAGMTKLALGKAIGHQGGRYISDLESGKKHPGPEMITRLAAALDITAADLQRRHDWQDLPFAQICYALDYTRNVFGQPA